MPTTKIIKKYHVVLVPDPVIVTPKELLERRQKEQEVEIERRKIDEKVD